jgi:excisionase family DNA binding protein
MVRTTDRQVRKWVTQGRLRALRTPGGRYRIGPEDLAALYSLVNSAPLVNAAPEQRYLPERRLPQPREPLQVPVPDVLDRRIDNGGAR